MRVLALTLFLVVAAIAPRSAEAAGAAKLFVNGAKYHASDTITHVRHIKKGRYGYRTSSDRHLRKYFFPPYQWRVTRCSYYDYMKFYRGKDRTYRCWRRKPKYLKRRSKHHW